jgi:hypothetical protein
MEPGAASDVPQWHAAGDWFDVCRCDIPCPCEFAQPPTDNWCQGVLTWHIREGHYGDVTLDGLNLVALGYFEGNIWAGEAAVALGLFIDERADERQREALQMIFGGQVGGWPAQFAELVGEMRGVEFVPIEVEVADDLAYWRAEIPGRGAGKRRGPGRADDAGGAAGTAAQPPRQRGGTGTGGHLGQDNGPPRGRLRMELRVGRQVQQTHPLRVERPVVVPTTLLPLMRGQGL